MKILLTGATGFLGSHLLRGLLHEGHEVHVIKRSRSDLKRIEVLKEHKNIFFYDIDKIEPDEIFQNSNIEIIIHVATEYGRNNESTHDILLANVILPVRLIESGIKYGVRSFLNTDSYFNKENYRYSNLLNYSLSKRSLMTWLMQFSSKIQIINASLEHVYGPEDSGSKFVEMLFREISIKKVDRLGLTHGHQRRDFIHVDDVVEAYVYLIEYAQNHSFSFKNFEIGSGECMEIRELALKIKNASKSNTTLGFGDITYRSDEIMQSKADIKQMAELGWRHQISVDAGVSKILELYLENDLFFYR